MTEPSGMAATASGAPAIKCVVWDLDHTLWDGVLMEDGIVRVRDEALAAIVTLDKHGILNSIASHNDPDVALRKLEELGISDYFLAPQVGWNSKVALVQEIARSLNLGLDTFAFVDDDPFERDEVAFSLPEVLCIDARDVASIPSLPRMTPRFLTEDSSKRRLLYLTDRERDRAERDFVGPKDAFLATLGMVFTIAPATEDDLQRAEELTVRTHQLNSTGVTYSYAELLGFIRSPRHELLIASLDDRYGTYGRIGLVLVEHGNEIWTIKLLLMSCRVIARGVGGTLLQHVIRCARAAGVRLRAEFLPTDRNRMMHITYRFAGFQEVDRADGVAVLELRLGDLAPQPDYIEVRVASERAGL